MLLNRDTDTICAVATPAGVGGISVIRLSGDQALKIARKVCPRLKEDPKSHYSYFSEFIDPNLKTQLDEGLCTYFKKGNSYTGDETIELSCHGNPRICDSILRTLVSLGARLADRGEFTYRAFMNGKIDLVQAESVLATIESQSQQATQLALRQLKGELSNILTKNLDLLVWVAAHIEAGIDFSSEGLDTIDHKVTLQKLAEVEESLNTLLSSYRSGRLIKEGLKVVLVGKPNVGKSSLLNLLLQNDRAIVTAIAGTTRDLIEGQTSFQGMSYLFTDTAGLRISDDEVEKIGIERSKEALKESDAQIWVLDGSQALDSYDYDALKHLNPGSLWVCINKEDLGHLKDFEGSLKSLFKQRNFFLSPEQEDHFFKNRVLSVSALNKGAREQILNSLYHTLVDSNFENSVSVSNARHFEGLKVAFDNIVRAQQMLSSGDGAEFITFEIKEAILRVQEVLGQRFDDDIMDRVFKEFCIGK